MVREQDEDVVERVRSLTSPDQRIVFVSGNFNVVHPGHLRLLKFAHARQKSEGEKAINAEAERLDATRRLNIVRLTKILAVDTPPLPDWFAAFERGETIRPFSDLIFAPMSLRFTAESLATIGEKSVPGNLHLSGADNVSYVDLAHKLAEATGVDRKLVALTTFVQMGVRALFAPKYSGMGMTRTTALTGLHPEPLDVVVKYLIDERLRARRVA